MTISVSGASVSSGPAIVFDRAFAPYSGAAFSKADVAERDSFDEQDGEISLPTLSTVMMIAGSSGLACLALFGALAWIAQSLD